MRTRAAVKSNSSSSEEHPLNETTMQNASTDRPQACLRHTSAQGCAGRLPSALPQLVPEAFDHTHALDTYSTADDHQIVYCTLCGTEW
jgi:hypothetical protein